MSMLCMFRTWGLKSCRFVASFTSICPCWKGAHSIRPLTNICSPASPSIWENLSGIIMFIYLISNKLYIIAVAVKIRSVFVWSLNCLLYYVVNESYVLPFSCLAIRDESMEEIQSWLLLVLLYSSARCLINALEAILPVEWITWVFGPCIGASVKRMWEI